MKTPRDPIFPRKKQNAKNIIDLRKITVVSQKLIYKKTYDSDTTVSATSTENTEE